MVYSSIAASPAGAHAGRRTGRSGSRSPRGRRHRDPAPRTASASPRRSSALGQGQIAPDRLSQVGQVQSAEHAVPVGVVALRPADGAAGRRRIAPLPATERGERLHLLVHPVGLGVLDQEVAPVGAPDQRAVGARHPRLAQVALQPDQPQRGVGRQRPALHLAVGRGRQIGDARRSAPSSSASLRRAELDLAVARPARRSCR